jgi:hypothetical protein
MASNLVQLWEGKFTKLQHYLVSLANSAMRSEWVCSKAPIYLPPCIVPNRLRKCQYEAFNVLGMTKYCA